MTIEDNKRILSAFIQEVFDGKNLDAADKYLSPNFLHHDRAPGEQTRNQTGRAGVKTFLGDVVFPAFSEFKTVFEDVIAEDDLVAARWRQASVHTGPWLGRPATRKRSEIAGISVVRIRDGLIVEEWEANDTLSLLGNLGVQVPKPKLPRRPSSLDAPSPEPGPAVPFLTNGPLGSIASPADVSKKKSLTARVFSEGWTKGDTKALDKILAPGYVRHDPSGLASGDRSRHGDLIKEFRTGLPNLAVSVDLALGQGDLVVNRWTAKGTQRGKLFDVPAKGRPVAVGGISVFRVGGDQIQEEWSLWDQLSLYAQLGEIRV